MGKQTMKSLRLLAALLAAVVMPFASAQVPTLGSPGTITGTFHAEAYAYSSNPAIYTVGSGKVARVTDVFLVNFSTTTGCVGAVRTPSGDLWWRVEAGQVHHFALNAGLGVVGPASIGAYGQTCQGLVYITIRGFFFTVP